MMTLTVAALYKFAAFSEPDTLRDPLFTLADSLGVKGTILLAHEGVNGTIAGSVDAIAAVVAHIREFPDCALLDVKYSTAMEPPFQRLKVRLKREIVTLGVDGIDPARDTGAYVEPSEWNALIDDPDTVVIDTRNAYEVAIGSFNGAIDPGTVRFGDFPAWFSAHRDELEGKRIAMFCTGGIRCEKSTAFVRAKGFADVFHLKGGILAYLEQVAAEDSRWQGDCFVFDERVSVGHELVPGPHSLCRACRMPLSPVERQLEAYVEGVQCPHCVHTRNAQQRDRYAERQRQIGITVARGIPHLGDAAAERQNGDPGRRPADSDQTGG